MFLELSCHLVPKSVRSVVLACCDPEWAFPVGTKLSCSGVFSGFASHSPYEVVGLKSSWLNLCIVSSCYLELSSFFSDPSHFLDFVCCLNSTLMFSSFYCCWNNNLLVDGSQTLTGIMAFVPYVSQ